MTDLISIQYQKGRGRFAVAKKDIDVGRTILNEKPIAWTLHPDRFGSHCTECMKQIKSVVPCRTCCGVSFCCIECRDTALNSYHKYVCGLLEILVASGLNVYPFLVIRLIARFGFDYLWELKDTLKYDESAGTQEKVSSYRSDDFEIAYNLVSHKDSLDSESYLLRTFIAVFLLKLLKFNKFFPPSIENLESSKEELYIGQIILHFVISLPQNVHDIALLETPESRKWSNSNNIKSLGAGVYLTAAMFNHSCNPSFMRSNHGKGMVSVTNRLIKAGEEISECYGQMYYTKNNEQRRSELRKHYKFECGCEACLENWPTIKDMKYAQSGGMTKPEHLNRFRCQHCRQVLDRVKGITVKSDLTCLVCGNESKVDDIPLEEIAADCKKAENLLSEQINWIEGIKAVKEAQEKFDKYLLPPNLELYNTQISIWRAMWLLVGNKKLVRPF